MQGAFGLKVDEYKQVKDLERENLRDHMTDIELILTMLAEATTTKLHRDRDSQGMAPLKKDAKDGGAVAGRTRKDIEPQTGKPVVSRSNYLPPPADGAVLENGVASGKPIKRKAVARKKAAKMVTRDRVKSIRHAGKSVTALICYAAVP